MTSVDINNLPPERPAAPFLVEPQPWVPNGACHGGLTRAFYEDIDGPYDDADDEREPEEKLAAIHRAQTICASCTERIPCSTQAMMEEGGTDETMRFGFRAYMTPEQRVSIHRRGGLLGRDPMYLVNGIDGDRLVPGVPIEGDRWSRHHTTLARKVVKWVNANRKVGKQLPTVAALARTLECHPQPLKRVLDALVQDGTLDLGVAGKGYVRRGTARALGWLPLHLRHTTD